MASQQIPGRWSGIGLYCASEHVGTMLNTATWQEYFHLAFLLEPRAEEKVQENHFTFISILIYNVALAVCAHIKVSSWHS